MGEPLHLRLVSDDVVHSFALGQSDFEPVDVLPGKPTEVTLTFDEPGTYTFYCTRWCGVDHWCMRGTVTVAGDHYADQTLPDPLLYLQLGIDLDASHIRQVKAIFGICKDNVVVFQDGDQLVMEQCTPTTCQDDIVPG